MPGPQNKAVRTIIFIMLGVVALGIGIALQYYRGVNQSVDPRVREARQFYEKYNEFAQLSQYDSVFMLMDTIGEIYASIPHYRNSYEVGVLHNNRAATYLTIFLQPAVSFPLADTLELLAKAEKETKKSIDIYEQWLSIYNDLEAAAIRDQVKTDFLRGLESYDLREQEKFLNKRVKELLEAQTENQRRLSVSYTNLGFVKRHQQKYDSAAICYQKAIELWDRNLTAENNLNILLNRPLKKRRVIESLFPPEK